MVCLTILVLELVHILWICYYYASFKTMKNEGARVFTRQHMPTFWHSSSDHGGFRTVQIKNISMKIERARVTRNSFRRTTDTDGTEYLTSVS